MRTLYLVKPNHYKVLRKTFLYFVSYRERINEIDRLMKYTSAPGIPISLTRTFLVQNNYLISMNPFIKCRRNVFSSLVIEMGCSFRAKNMLNMDSQLRETSETLFDLCFFVQNNIIAKTSYTYHQEKSIIEGTTL